MDPRTAGVAALFDRVSDTYDAVEVPWFGPIAAALVDELAPRAGERALDVGCGRGAVLRLLADAVGTDGLAVGVDVAPGMVRRTADDLAHLPQVRVHVGDAAAPAGAPGSFDVVASSLVLFFLPQPAAALQAWVALLRPGGRLGVTTFGPQDDTWRQVDALFEPYLPQQVLDARTSGRTGPFGSDEGMEQLLRDAGLVDVRTRVVEQEAVFDDAAHWHRWTRSHAQRGMWEAVPADRRDDVLQEAGALLDGARRDDGRLVLRQAVRTTVGRAAQPDR